MTKMMVFNGLHVNEYVFLLDGPFTPLVLLRADTLMGGNTEGKEGRPARERRWGRA